MRNIFKKLRQYRFEISLLIISGVVYHRWLSFKIFAHADWEFSFAEQLWDHKFLSLWQTYYGMGKVGNVIWRYPIEFVHRFFGFMQYDSNIADKFTVIWPSVFLLGLGSFYLINKFVKSKRASFIGALLFAFNTYFLAINSQGHTYINTAVAFALFSFVFFVDYVRQFDIRKMILCSLFLSLSGIYDFRILYLFSLVFILYFLFHLFYIYKNFSYRSLIKTVFLSALPFLFVILFNLFWCIGYFLAGENDVLNRGLFGDEFWSIVYSFALFHPFWSISKISWFEVQPIPVYLWLLPITAFSGLYINRKNKHAFFFGIVAIIGIFLSKQRDLPFPFVYSWLYEYFPGFNAFREATKFYILTAIGYAVLISFFFKYIFEKKEQTKIYKYISALFSIAFIFFIMINTWLICSSKAQNTFSPKILPNDYVLFKNLIAKSDDFYRVLWVPGQVPFSYADYKHPLLIGSTSHWGDYSVNIEYRKDYLDMHTQIFHEPYADKLFDVSCIKYIVIPLEEKENGGSVFSETNVDRESLVSNLKNIPFLQEVNFGQNELAVFENKEFLPHIYLTYEMDSVLKDMPYEKANFFFKHPTKYEIQLNNILKPVYINFSESYHPKWQAVAGDFNLEALFRKRNVLKDEYHFESEVNTNVFIIDPDYIKENHSQDLYTLNSDGSMNVNITLYFYPQIYVYLGMIISAMTLVICLILLINRSKKNSNEEKSN